MQHLSSDIIITIYISSEVAHTHASCALLVLILKESIVNELQNYRTTSAGGECGPRKMIR